MSQPCIICNNTTEHKVYNVKELQLGLMENFDYQLCGNCGSMQLLNIPKQLDRYYPLDNYYSFNLRLPDKNKTDKLRKTKATYLLYGKNSFFGRLLSIGYKMPDYYQWMKNSDTHFNDAILDIGTGNGNLLMKLFQIGFTNLTGIDPFINESKKYSNIKILKQNIFETTGTYDLIMMHHSLEHMFEPLKVLEKAKSLIKPGKHLLIRIPIMGNYGWKKYGIYWCGIDAPRHIFIPSEKGLYMLAEKAGFEINKAEYDSTEYVIWCSEQYLKGIPLHADNSWMQNKTNSIFTRKKIKEFRKEIEEENKNNNGDTIALYLRRPS
jgi:SAM-dependent methyltransferase